LRCRPRKPRPVRLCTAPNPDAAAVLSCRFRRFALTADAPFGQRSGAAPVSLGAARLPLAAKREDMGTRAWTVASQVVAATRYERHLILSFCFFWLAFSCPAAGVAGRWTRQASVRKPGQRSPMTAQRRCNGSVLSLTHCSHSRFCGCCFLTTHGVENEAAQRTTTSPGITSTAAATSAGADSQPADRFAFGASGRASPGRFFARPAQGSSQSVSHALATSVFNSSRQWGLVNRTR
jgi:hypothetical protein